MVRCAFTCNAAITFPWLWESLAIGRGGSPPRPTRQRGDSSLARRVEGLLVLRTLVQPVEVGVQAGPELFGQRRAGVAGRLRRARGFADFLLVGAAADQAQGRIGRRSAAAAAGGRAGPAAP